MRIVFVSFSAPSSEWASPVSPQFIAAFDKQEDAEKAARGQGAWGIGDGPVTGISVLASWEEYIEDLRERQHVAGNDSLTAIERSILERESSK